MDLWNTAKHKLRTYLNSLTKQARISNGTHSFQTCSHTHKNLCLPPSPPSPSTNSNTSSIFRLNLSLVNRFNTACSIQLPSVSSMPWDSPSFCGYALTGKPIHALKANSRSGLQRWGELIRTIRCSPFSVWEENKDLCCVCFCIHVKDIIANEGSLCASHGCKVMSRWGANMIYIVEVLARMLTLAASRLSMIALEKETERSGAWMENRGGRHGKRGKKN